MNFIQDAMSQLGMGNNNNNNNNNQFNDNHHHVHGHKMHSDQQLTSGQFIMSESRVYFAVMQHDGNFVLYKNRDFHASHAVWASHTNGKGHPPYRLVMQGDGNLVIYDHHNHPTWSSNTCGHGHAPYRLVLQDDRNLVIYDHHNHPTWASNTNTHEHPPASWYPPQPMYQQPVYQAPVNSGVMYQPYGSPYPPQSPPAQYPPPQPYGQPYPPQQGYPPYQQGPYPPQGQPYPPQGQYPPPQGQYPPPQGQYPPQGQGQVNMYPPQPYNPQSPQQPYGYPPQDPAYPAPIPPNAPAYPLSQPVQQQPAAPAYVVPPQPAGPPPYQVEEKKAAADDPNVLIKSFTENKFRIYNPAHNMTYAFLTTDHKIGGDVVAVLRSDGMNDEKAYFQLVPAVNGLYRIFHCLSRQFLFVSDNLVSGDRVVKARPDYDHASGHFRLVHLGGKKFRLQNPATGTGDGECVLFGAADKTGGDFNIEARAGMKDPRSEFELLIDDRAQVAAEGEQLLAKMSQSKFRLRAKAFHDANVFVSEDKLHGDLVVELRPNMQARNEFQLLRTQNGLYRILHLATNQYLFVSDNLLGGDRVVKARPEYDQPAAHFKLVYLGDNKFHILNSATGTAKDGDAAFFGANDKTGGNFTMEARAGLREPRAEFTVEF